MSWAGSKNVICITLLKFHKNIIGWYIILIVETRKKGDQILTSIAFYKLVT